mmetsp:Transcript_21668/g.26099  ORF Transcript_21668/g.26099 Transcript_21668/m.26099 type:complete len:117 (-) Transcript_21668:391-741(-)
MTSESSALALKHQPGNRQASNVTSGCLRLQPLIHRPELDTRTGLGYGMGYGMGYDMGYGINQRMKPYRPDLTWATVGMLESKQNTADKWASSQRTSVWVHSRQVGALTANLTSNWH